MEMKKETTRNSFLIVKNQQIRKWAIVGENAAHSSSCTILSLYLSDEKEKNIESWKSRLVRIAIPYKDEEARMENAVYFTAVVGSIL